MEATFATEVGPQEFYRPFDVNADKIHAASAHAIGAESDATAVDQLGTRLAAELAAEVGIREFYLPLDVGVF
jgi:hypothetical protein